MPKSSPKHYQTQCYSLLIGWNMWPSGTIPRHVKEIPCKKISPSISIILGGKNCTWTSHLHRKCSWENSHTFSESWTRREILQPKKAYLWNPTADTAGLWLSTIQRQCSHRNTVTPLCLQPRTWDWDAGSKGYRRRAGGMDGSVLVAGDCPLHIQEFREGSTHHQSWWASDDSFIHIPGQTISQPQTLDRVLNINSK